MSIPGLLDGGGIEILYRSGFGKGHLGKGGLDTEGSSHGSEPTEELHRRLISAQKKKLF